MDDIKSAFGQDPAKPHRRPQYANCPSKDVGRSLLVSINVGLGYHVGPEFSESVGKWRLRSGGATPRVLIWHSDQYFHRMKTSFERKTITVKCDFISFKMSLVRPEIDERSSDVYVVVPSYNHAPFIEKCLRSIISQTLRPKKLLVIDDGSRDDSPQIIAEALKECDFDSELIVRENRGLCATLNQGLEASSGVFFAYIGSDDFWMPQFLEERVNLLSKRRNAVLGYGHSYLIDDQNRVFHCTADVDDDWAKYADGDPRKMLLNGVSPISSTVVYRREHLERSPWNEQAKLEDYEMYVRLMPMGEFAFDPQVLSAWRQHSYNTSRNLTLIHSEVIAAQQRNLALFGVDQNELLYAQSRSRFRYGRELLQFGKKREAITLLAKSWRYAPSLRSFIKPTLQFLLPTRLLAFYRSRKRSRLARRYSHVSI